MLRVLLIEDEPLFREGVISSLDWTSLGMEIPDQAFDGLHALSLMDKISYDYVITDLFMPRMGGIEFLQTATKKHPLTNYIVLSGYNDFELVKEAFLLGVVDYILKSEISQQQIKAVITKQACIRSRILTQDYSVSLGKINSFFIKQGIFRKSGNAINLLGETAITGLQIPVHPGGGHIYCCAVCLHLYEVQLGHKTYQESRQEFFSAIDSIIMEEHSLFGFDRRGFYYLLSITEMPMNWRQLDDYWRKIHKTIISRLSDKITAVSLGFSSSSAGLVNLEQIIRESTNILDFRLLISDSTVLSNPKIQAFKNRTPTNTLSVDSLATSLASLNKKNISSSLKTSCLNYNEVKYSSPLDVSSYYEKIYSLFLSFQEPLKLSANEDFQQTMRRYLEIKLLDRSYVDYNAWLKKLNEIIENSICHFDKLTEQAIGIINKQYNDKNLSLISIALILKTNPSYLSRVFSADIGKGLSLFLLEYRIDMATELIKQGSFKLYEVANIVGFENYETFSRAFKRLKGESPQNY